ncbi:MAG: DNA-formamidopyrimidine glycosylase family protein, partial [Candidatus Microgenomates bacterium]
MPELPEIETVKLQLQKTLVGQKLLGVEVLSPKIVKSDLTSLVNKKVEGIERLGKVLLISFGEKLNLGFHFKMTGQLVLVEKGKRVVGGHPTVDFWGPM